MLRIGAVVMNVSDVDRAGAFWSAALGYTRQPHNPAFLAPEGSGGTRLHLDGEDRTHLDLWADDEADQRAQVDRLISLGARRVDWDYPDDADFVVLADPDGNLFCVIAWPTRDLTSQLIGTSERCSLHPLLVHSGYADNVHYVSSVRSGQVQAQRRMKARSSTSSPMERP
ncbi:hypothetical protein KCQ71_02910 [Ruania sp. N2-46]|uniref:VOC domain-containing protein n=1 Tax=Occultella gossypii TaxID=2800820 RepID=A0ABS7S427_9MICO|nr:VOC family protein [Occultella gossypii]MBZ2195092.1 hypothetical protein [Occultella gossypii]